MRELLERFLVLVHFFKADEEGQGLAEYALILVLVAIVCVVALLFLGTSINTVLCNVGSTIVGAPS
jgi:pilus assembly protein Flp/PilA